MSVGMAASAAGEFCDGHHAACIDYARRHLTEEHDHSAHALTDFAIAAGLLALLATFICGFILEHNHIHWIPEAAVGIAFGAMVAYASPEGPMMDAERFDFAFFLTWLLPPVIFEAGFNMNVRAFFDSIVPTAMYAFIGTMLSTFLVGGLVWLAGQYGLCYPMGMLASLTFGSLISATDPVTVLAVFQSIGVKVDLFSMVFGESVLNDAVAIVLSKTLLSFTHEEVTPEAIGGAVLTFAKIFLGSMAIGIGFGMSSAIMFKALHLKEHSHTPFLEVALSFPWPWMAYFLAEALSLSGIVAIMFAGIIMAIYTRLNFSEEASKLASQAYKCLAMVAETFIFVYLGMSIPTFPILEQTTFKLVGYALIACFLGRLHIYFFTWVINRFRTPASIPPPISQAYNFVMWWSGLRGGVAFAIAANVYGQHAFPQSCGGLPLEQRVGPACEGHTDGEAILQITMLIAVFTIIVFGGSITVVANKLGVLAGPGEVAEHDEQHELVVTSHRVLLNSLTRENTFPKEEFQRNDAALTENNKVSFKRLSTAVLSGVRMSRGSRGPGGVEMH
eukprot:CAMPEP_0183356842 /NCGR_PEP_ID=MMETSP0164_2-20130417/45219_1 /TAXON_ID=221442 /ORGANISM="Coccolithus pelagicus ssp braarudi, Strain PLY182g" /LENGTH=559 /DNA_ID=CAMNT_0025530345 /DNA_START=22 /DNA_END=1701 /DNA_ORIENTATION=-